MTWLIIELTDDVHIVPTYEEHELTVACPCVPELEYNDAWLGRLVKHNDTAELFGMSFDDLTVI